jgi:hypothetical protein
MVILNIVWSLGWDYEELQGLDNKIHIRQSYLRVPDKLDIFLVSYHESSRRFMGSHKWGQHIQRDDTGLKRDTPAYMGQCVKALKGKHAPSRKPTRATP